MQSLIRWWFLHAGHWAVLYGAFAAQMEGAMSVLKFWVWLMAPLSLFLVADKAATDAAKKPARPVLGWLGMFQAWVTLGLLVWFGHIATGVAWFVVIGMCAYHRDATRRARAAAAATAT